MYLILMTMLFLGCYTTLNAQNNDQWARLSRYAKANAEWKNGNPERPTAVFIGNSITQGWYDKRPGFFTANNYAGRGISGQTTPQFLSRFRADVIALNPQIVVINGGINDIAENSGVYDPDFTFGNIQSMAELAHANGIAVILTSVLPAENIPWRTEIADVPEKIRTLNTNIQDYAADKGFTYVDYYTSMVDAQKAMAAVYTTDGVHVTDKGYQVMEAIVKTAIDELLKK
ncbi:MAG: GDSL-type esterase/lipase family protein [Prevotellaceae bacterium]|jgi:lysophospholipase L1-like esterase|nr:GDSL-type esterase/lipase family protein [Prevotellaceae bacterium]